jgi:hypothetical protein
MQAQSTSISSSWLMHALHGPCRLICQLGQHKQFLQESLGQGKFTKKLRGNEFQSPSSADDANLKRKRQARHRQRCSYFCGMPTEKGTNNCLLKLLQSALLILYDHLRCMYRQPLLCLIIFGTSPALTGTILGCSSIWGALCPPN